MSLTLAPSTPAPTAVAMQLLPSMPAPSAVPRISPLMIADYLITLAEHADRGGFQQTASSLLDLVFDVLDERGAPN